MISSLSELVRAPAASDDLAEARRIPIASIVIGLVMAINLVCVVTTLAAHG